MLIASANRTQHARLTSMSRNPQRPALQGVLAALVRVDACSGTFLWSNPHRGRPSRTAARQGKTRWRSCSLMTCTSVACASQGCPHKTEALTCDVECCPADCQPGALACGAPGLVPDPPTMDAPGFAPGGTWVPGWQVRGQLLDL